jgi:hypothetical protein
MCAQCLDILADGIQQGRDEMRAELAEEQDDDVITTTTDTIRLVWKEGHTEGLNAVRQDGEIWRREQLSWNKGYEQGRNTMRRDVIDLLTTYGPLNSVIPEIMKLLDRELS